MSVKPYWEGGGEGNPVNQDCGRVEFVGLKGTVGTDIMDIGNKGYFRAFFYAYAYVPLLEDFFWWPLHTKSISSWEKSGWQSTPDSRNEGKRKPTKRTPM